MTALLRQIPAVAAVGMILLSKATGFATPGSRAVALLPAAAAVAAVLLMLPRDNASPIHKGMAVYSAGMAAAAGLLPAGAAPLLSRYAAAALYFVLFLVAVLPPLLGKDPFTTWFARKDTPEAVWNTDLFQRINRHLTGLWAILFAVGAVSGLVPGIFGLRGLLQGAIFEMLLPGLFLLGVGVPANRLYPAYCQRKSGLLPTGSENGQIQAAAEQSNPSTGKIPHTKEDRGMNAKYTVVAVNGSPHAGVGNTAMLIGMLQESLAAEGIAVETIHLSDREIEYCTGCGHCMEKGKCWIVDDHAGIVDRLLAADGIILASPVYFSHVTAQAKAFIDRGLALGHKPRGTWKPGIAVSVSAGLGETQVAEYLSAMLRPYGAFAVGQLTALATSPGEFLGKEAVEARAGDLARDLARTIREKRRYPATEWDLRYYQFMGALVRENRDSMMKDDHRHWEALRLYSGFETYVQQKKEPVQYDPEIRRAWLKETIARHKAGKDARKAAPRDTAATSSRKPAASSCRELLQSMPLGFEPAAAGDLEAVYQFEIGGSEEFTAHLRIEGGKCAFHEGPADRPGVVIRSPADVWMGISRGEIDGRQAFMTGRYKVEGDLSLLMKLGSLFRT
jgi:multimeric flavodoxin WrbA/putative sterol carrier protein